MSRRAYIFFIDVIIFQKIYVLIDLRLKQRLNEIFKGKNYIRPIISCNERCSFAWQGNMHFSSYFYSNIGNFFYCPIKNEYLGAPVSNSNQLLINYCITIITKLLSRFKI
jgi:hypothetical protein